MVIKCRSSNKEQEWIIAGIIRGLGFIIGCKYSMLTPRTRDPLLISVDCVEAEVLVCCSGSPCDSPLPLSTCEPRLISNGCSEPPPLIILTYVASEVAAWPSLYTHSILFSSVLPWLATECDQYKTLENAQLN